MSRVWLPKATKPSGFGYTRLTFVRQEALIRKCSVPLNSSARNTSRIKCLCVQAVSGRGISPSLRAQQFFLLPKFIHHAFLLPLLSPSALLQCTDRLPHSGSFDYQFSFCKARLSSLSDLDPGLPAAVDHLSLVTAWRHNGTEKKATQAFFGQSASQLVSQPAREKWLHCKCWHWNL